MNEYLMNHLKESSIKAELHAAKTGECGAVEYLTMGTGSIPLHQLLSSSSGLLNRVCFTFDVGRTYNAIYMAHVGRFKCCYIIE